MAEYTYENIKVRGAPDVATALVEAVTEYFNTRLDLDTPPTQEEIDAAIAAEQQIYQEETDLSDFTQTAVNEVAWIDSALTQIDTADLSLLRQALKRVLQENRAIIKYIALREKRKARSD